MSVAVQKVAELNRACAWLLDRGSHEEALAAAAQAFRLAFDLLGPAHPDTATSLANRGCCLDAMGNYEAARPCYERALTIRRNVLGEDHPDTARSLNALGMVLKDLGELAEARLYLEQALAIFRKAPGEGQRDLGLGLNNLGFLLQAMGDYAGARTHYDQALAIRRASLGEDDPDTANSLNNLGFLLQETGDYAGARPYFEQSLAINRKAFGEAHPDTARGLNNLGFVHEQLGDHATARPYYEKALAIRRQVLGEDHPATATSLNNLGFLLTRMGDDAGARPYYEQALAICRKTLGEVHVDTAGSLNNLGSLLMSMAKYAKARPYLEQALTSYRKALGEEHPAAVPCLGNLGALHQFTGDYAGARSYYEQALTIGRKALGESHPSTASSLCCLGHVLKEMGDYAGARPCLEQALAATRKALGESHPSTATMLRVLAILCVAEGRVVEAWMGFRQAADIDDHAIGRVFAVGSENQRARFLANQQVNLEYFLSLVLCHLAHSAPAVRTALDLVLRRQALGAEGLAAQRDAVLGGRYPQLEQRLRDLVALRTTVARKSLDGPGREGAAAHGRQLGELDVRRQQMETELARQIPEINLEQNLRAADRRAIALALGEGVALVEFVRLNVFDFRAVPARGELRWKPARYLAFVLSADDPEDVRMVDLGEAAPIDRLIADFRQGVTADPQDGAGRDLRRRRTDAAPAAKEAGPALRAAVFDPLASALGGRTRLVLAPDGDLSRLPFEVLPDASGRPLLGNYRLSYAGSGRDVLRFGQQANRTPAAPVVVCDPDFDFDGAAAAPPPPSPGAGQRGQPPAQSWLKLPFFSRPRADAPPPQPPHVGPAWAAAAPGRCSRDFSRGDYHFPRLAGTHEEGARIAGLLGVRAVAGRDAVEARLKGTHSPRLLHLATHGFFLADQERDPNEQLDNLAAPGGTSGAGRLSGPLPENPLLRSGLALAGANTWLQGGTLPPEAEDGLLTAEDVAGMDLLDTELVVLSACETGLGEIHAGEGVFGLRRSFIVAGARTLVMSLWKVPDEQTKELMVDFYRRVLAGEGVADALREAQLAMRERYPEPYYWGAFICQGNPGPIRGQTAAPQGRRAAAT